MDTLPPTTKRCTRCGEEKPLTDFPRNRRQKDGWHYQCRECSNARRRQNPKYLAKAREYKRKHPEQMRLLRRAYREKNRERENEQQRDWYYANIEKARLSALQRFRRRRAESFSAPGSHTMEEWLAKVDRYDGRCHWCRKKITSLIHGDHVIPLSQGGSDDIDNIVPSCASCNSRKNNKHPHDFLLDSI